MNKKEFEELYWKIMGLFEEHAGCLSQDCHCGGDRVEFADTLHKLMYETLKPNQE